MKNSKDENNDFKTQYVKRKLALNLSDYQIAKQLEIKQSTISKWLKKNQVLETSSLINLSSILYCSVKFLLGRVNV